MRIQGLLFGFGFPPASLNFRASKTELKQFYDLLSLLLTHAKIAVAEKIDKLLGLDIDWCRVFYWSNHVGQNKTGESLNA